MNVQHLILKKFRSYVLRNLLMILLLCAIIIPVCINYYNRSTDSYMVTQKNALDASSSLLNKQMLMLDGLLERHARSTDSNLMALRSSLLPSDYLTVSDLHSIVSTMCASSDLLEDLFLVFPNSQTIVSKHGGFATLGTQSGYDYFMNYYSFSDSSFISEITAPPVSSVISFRDGLNFSCSGQSGTSDVAFIYGKPLGNSSTKIYAYLLISQSGLESLFSSVDGELLLYAPSGRQLATLFAADDGASFKLGDSNVLSAADSSRVSTLLHVNMDNYYALLHSSLLTLLLFSLGMILMSIALAVFSAYSTCQPLHKVLTTLKEYNPELPNYDDAFSYLLSGIENFHQVQENISSKLENTQRSLAQNYIDRCMHSPDFTVGLLPSDPNELPDIENFPLHYVLAYVVVNIGKSTQDEIDLRMLVTMLGNRLAAELDAILHPLHYYSFALIIPAVSDDDQQLNLLRERVHEISETMHLQLCVAVSSICDGIFQLNAAYKSARAVMASRASEPGVHVANFEDKPAHMPIHDSIQLYEAVVSGNYPAAHDILLEQMTADTPFADVEQRYYYARAPLLMAQRDVCPDSTSMPPSYSLYQSPRQLFGHLDEFMRAVCEKAALNRSTSESSAETENIHLSIDRVIQYINDNYGRDDLSVQIICNECSINEKALNEICRTAIGMNASAYIRQLRMDKASSLLRNTDTKVIDILKICGYNTPNAFYKAFKQTYGKSPSEYRSMFR